MAGRTTGEHVNPNWQVCGHISDQWIIAVVQVVSARDVWVAVSHPLGGGPLVAEVAHSQVSTGQIPVGLCDKIRTCVCSCVVAVRFLP